MKYLWLFTCLCFQAVQASTLFVCDGNTGRSFMAETIAQKFLYHDSMSRGLSVNDNTRVEDDALKVLAEWNLYQYHTARQLLPEDVQNADLVLTMTAPQKDQLIQQYPEYSDKIYSLSECSEARDDDIPDAIGKPIGFYRTIRDQIFYHLDIISTRGWLCLPKKNLFIILLM